MQRDSGSWYADDGTWYYFDIWTSVRMQEQTPQDYEHEVHTPQLYGRYRYCHAFLDRHNDSDPSKICNMFHRNLFDESIKFTPWEHEIPKEFKVDSDSEIFNHIDSMCRAEHNKNVDKSLIVAAFGVFMTNHDSEADEEIGFVPASKSSIEALEKVSDLDSEFECVVCFQEEKKQAKRMPCGHVFHDRCIEEWLEKSHLCPVCRYAMPGDS
ncbi:mitogen-activated protein kinase kinase kinase [Hibiscus syriacus]|uniref:RING-type E3 ubiquitin transferase n=1 Tax=Hibiscus syriacus TaxID=106335 RepID=A0A6A2ZB45_HIBSY|nr:E3 ubiquitin-protein ligase At3g02290-like [Hibiscus syriacus]KAE8688967.1 mitogen-activated protein kinase kinase kinase [Hibiscus syriacus]